jgi:hypothetical protein
MYSEYPESFSLVELVDKITEDYDLIDVINVTGFKQAVYEFLVPSLEELEKEKLVEFVKELETLKENKDIENESYIEIINAIQKQEPPNDEWCIGCTPDNCTGGC